MLLTIALVLATAFPSTSRTSWMTPQSFHLTIGMTREETLRALETKGWPAKKGRNGEEMVVDYSDDKALTLEFRDKSVPLAAGEMYVVPRGVEHRPVAEQECSVMLVEPRGVVNTGDAGGARTAPNDVWV